MCAGVRGPLTGRGFDLGVIDDPVKNDEEAFSEVYREKTWEWYRSTFSTRGQPDSAIVLITTRWHEDDLAGRLIQAMVDGGDQWEILSLPAIAEEDETHDLDGDTWKREIGDPLCPHMFPAKELEAIKKRVGSYWFSSMYQQHPSPEGGGIFKKAWMKYYHVVQSNNDVLRYGKRNFNIWDMHRYQTVDLATSKKTMADYTVISTWGVIRGYLFLLDVHRERLEGPDIVPAIKSSLKRWRSSVVWIESNGFQLSMVQTARRHGLPVRELIHRVSKEVRAIHVDPDPVSKAMSATALLEAGGVIFPANAHYMADCEAEMMSFPAGKHDDFVDTFTDAVRVAYDASLAAPDPPVTVDEYEEADPENLFEEVVESRIKLRQRLRKQMLGDYRTGNVDWKKEW